jgi:hypothetical protein
MINILHSSLGDILDMTIIINVSTFTKIWYHRSPWAIEQIRANTGTSGNM